MPTKMRLQRHGKKGKPFYHIVIADGRAPRDGRFIEKIGTYNPIPNPAEINLNADKALDWIQKGAQPSDTVRAILTYKGILYKNHLLKGVKKGAFSETEAEAKFQNWMKEKEDKVDAKRKNLDDISRASLKERMDAETKVNEDRAAEIAKRRKDAEDAQVKEAQDAAAETEVVEEAAPVEKEMITKEAVEEKVKETAPKVKEEKPKAEEVKAEKPKVKKEPKAEKPEVKEEAKTEKPVAKAKEEVAEEPKAEKPAAEKKTRRS